MSVAVKDRGGLCRCCKLPEYLQIAIQRNLNPCIAGVAASFKSGWLKQKQCGSPRRKRGSEAYF